MHKKEQVLSMPKSKSKTKKKSKSKSKSKSKVKNIKVNINKEWVMLSNPDIRETTKYMSKPTYINRKNAVYRKKVISYCHHVF